MNLLRAPASDATERSTGTVETGPVIPAFLVSGGHQMVFWREGVVEQAGREEFEKDILLTAQTIKAELQSLEPNFQNAR